MAGERARPEELGRLARIYQNTARGTLTSACRTCACPVRPNVELCPSCSDHIKLSFPLSDLVVPLSYVVKEQNQAYEDLLNYKRTEVAVSASGRQNLRILLNESLSNHWECIRGQEPFSAVTFVPSSTGRSPHPLSDMLTIFNSSIARLEIADDQRENKRLLQPDRFTLERVGSTSLTNVLILEDLWVSGAQAQGVASVLKSAGASRVVIVALGRLIDPKNWEPTAQYVKARPKTFDFELCPVHGPKCPRATTSL